MDRHRRLLFSASRPCDSSPSAKTTPAATTTTKHLFITTTATTLLLLLLVVGCGTTTVTTAFSVTTATSSKPTRTSSPYSGITTTNTSHRSVFTSTKFANTGGGRSSLSLSSNTNEGEEEEEEYQRMNNPEGAKNTGDDDDNNNDEIVGKLEQLKQREAELSRLLSAVRQEKLQALRARPLKIGIVGFGRFGQFIARTFAKNHNVVVTSRSDYTDVANGMGVRYVSMKDPKEFVEEGLDVIVVAVSIVSFEDTIKMLSPHLRSYILGGGNSNNNNGNGGNGGGTIHGPLIVDVLSVKEHPRKILLEQLPSECDILCTHPMFGPDSAKHGWHGLNFVYERTRIDGVILDNSSSQGAGAGRSLVSSSGGTSTMAAAMGGGGGGSGASNDTFVDITGMHHSIHENSESHVEGMDRMERFLSIWEEEGCHMVPLSCHDHDSYAANSQFITHLMGRILGQQGLQPTPIDTKGFESVLKLIGSTTADSFDLFYGLYKYNQNSMDTILSLRNAMDDVVKNLKLMEEQDTYAPAWTKKRKLDLNDWVSLSQEMYNAQVNASGTKKKSHEEEEKKEEESGGTRIVSMGEALGGVVGRNGMTTTAGGSNSTIVGVGP